MKFDSNGNLIVADEHKGLLSIDSIGIIKVLTDEVDGTKIGFADHLDMDDEGVIWFSDATQRSHNVIQEIGELQATGRLLSYNPVNGQTKVAMEDLRFANGVAIVPDGNYLIISETIGMRVGRYWLRGSKKGEQEIFINELPGFPDNVSYNGDGVFGLLCHR